MSGVTLVRETEDGFIVEANTVSGVPVRLTVTGLDGSAAPLVILSVCRACGAELSRREYDAQDGAPPPEAIDAQASIDQLLTDTHQCPVKEGS